MDSGQSFSVIQAIHPGKVRADYRKAGFDYVHIHRYCEDCQTLLQGRKVWNVSVRGKQRKTQPAHYRYAGK